MFPHHVYTVEYWPHIQLDFQCIGGAQLRLLKILFRLLSFHSQAARLFRVPSSRTHHIGRLPAFSPDSLFEQLKGYERRQKELR